MPSPEERSLQTLGKRDLLGREQWPADFELNLRVGEEGIWRGLP